MIEMTSKEMKKEEKYSNLASTLSTSPSGSGSGSGSVKSGDDKDRKLQVQTKYLNTLEVNLKSITDVERYGIDYWLTRYPHDRSTGTMTFLYKLYCNVVGYTPTKPKEEEAASNDRRDAIEKMLNGGKMTGKASTWDTIKYYFPTLWQFSYVLPNKVIDRAGDGNLSQKWQKFLIVGFAGTFRFLMGVLEFFNGLINLPFKWFSRFTIAFVTPLSKLENFYLGSNDNNRGRSVANNLLNNRLLNWWKKEIAPLDYLETVEYQNTSSNGKKLWLRIKATWPTYFLSIPIHILNIFLLGTIKLILDRAGYLLSYNIQIITAIFTLIGKPGNFKEPLLKIWDGLKRMSPEIIAIVVGVAVFFGLGLGLIPTVAVAAFAGLTYVIGGAIVARFRAADIKAIEELNKEKLVTNSEADFLRQNKIKNHTKAANKKTVIAITITLLVVALIVLAVVLTSGIGAFALPFALAPGALFGGGGYTALMLWLSMGGLGIYAWCAQKLSATIGTEEKISVSKKIDQVKSGLAEINKIDTDANDSENLDEKRNLINRKDSEKPKENGSENLDEKRNLINRKDSEKSKETEMTEMNVTPRLTVVGINKTGSLQVSPQSTGLPMSDSFNEGHVPPALSSFSDSKKSLSDPSVPMLVHSQNRDDESNLTSQQPSTELSASTLSKVGLMPEPVDAIKQIQQIETAQNRENTELLRR